MTLPGEEHGALGGDTEACWTVAELMKETRRQVEEEELGLSRKRDGGPTYKSYSSVQTVIRDGVQMFSV